MTPSSPEPTGAAGHAGHAGPADLVISGCTVLVHDDRGRIGFEQDAAVVVRGGVVDSVTTAAAGASVPAADRIDARGQVALPGLINCQDRKSVV